MGEDGHFIRTGEPCLLDDCGSSDARADNDKGWSRCFSCGRNYRTEGDYVGSVQRTESMSGKPFVEGSHDDLKKRGVSSETCKRLDYEVGRVPEDYPCSDKSPIAAMRGKTVHIENYYSDDGKKVGQKLRDSKKNFAIIGKVTECLFGKKANRAGGKLLVVTEGAIDALSYAEIRKNWPVVSIPGGGEGAAKAVKANLEWLESFDKVVFAFDNDEVGNDAFDDVQHLLTPGKCYKSALTPEYKDFNEALMDGDAKAILNAVFEAEEIRPDGLVGIDDIWGDILKEPEMGLPWFFPELTDLTYGRRWGELYGFGAPTGGGKTDFLTEQIAFDVGELGYEAGVFFLEQKPPETGKRLAGKRGNRRFHLPNDGLEEEEQWTVEELKEALEPFRSKVTFYDSFGQTDWLQVKTRIRHLALAKGIRIFYVDHLTAMANTSDEKGSLEQIMKELAGIANELSLIIHFVSHLTTPDGTPHEEGGQIAVRHFKGSRSIGFWSYFMFGLERNQQHEDEELRKRTTFRVLKDRYTGQATGHTLTTSYNAITGRIIPPSEVEEYEPELDEEGF